jgi:hypothetical protein
LLPNVPAAEAAGELDIREDDIDTATASHEINRILRSIGVEDARPIGRVYTPASPRLR